MSPHKAGCSNIACDPSVLLASQEVGTREWLCLRFVFLWWNTMTKNNCGRKWLLKHTLLRSYLFTEGSLVMNASRNLELKQRSHKNNSSTWVPYGLFRLLFCTTQEDVFRSCTVPSHWNKPLIQSLIKKKNHKVAYRSMWWKHFLDRSSLTPDNSSLC